jgi:hypothetical protein
MRRMGSTFVLSVVFVGIQGCASNESATTLLRTGTAFVCHAPSLLLSSRPDGGFAFGAGVFDSAQLVAALRTILPPRPEKLVMVSLDSTRQSSARWIVSAIESNGGSAYLPDSACLKPSVIASSAR